MKLLLQYGKYTCTIRAKEDTKSRFLCNIGISLVTYAMNYKSALYINVTRLKNQFLFSFQFHLRYTAEDELWRILSTVH
jgi:hypothetical protein